MSTPNGGDTNTVRALAPPGVILVDVAGRPIYFNTQAITVLTYPRRPKGWETARDLLPKEIRSLLPRSQGSDVAASATGLTSGRRRYVCRAVTLNPGMGNRSTRKMIVLLIERDSPKTTKVSELTDQFRFTHRELDTVRLLLQGLTDKEIANQLSISPNTVRAFLRLVMSKMQVSGRAGIMAKVLSIVWRPEKKMAA